MFSFDAATLAFEVLFRQLGFVGMLQEQPPRLRGEEPSRSFRGSTFKGKPTGLVPFPKLTWKLIEVRIQRTVVIQLLHIIVQRCMSFLVEARSPIST